MDIEQLVGEIADMDLDALRIAWRRRYGTPPPLRSVPFLRQMLAWRVQAGMHGGLDQDTCKALRRTGSPVPLGLDLGIGARLTRNWKGRRIVVVVEEGGFRWEGELFASLSAAATAIAGSKWNGPRFFGLQSRT